MTTSTDIDLSRCRLAPFAHQREDVAWLLDGRRHAFIASEMRTGKSAIVAWAAQLLFEAGRIDTVVVVAPAPVRDVWQDPTLGELAKHLWLDVSAVITEYHARLRTWRHGPESPHPLRIFVTNFEFLRAKGRLATLAMACKGTTLLVGDESSFLKNWSALQTKAFMQLRRKCGYCWLLNGTPIFHSPLDLFSQGNILSPDILDCPYVTLFKARYGIQTPVLERGKPMVRHGKLVQTVTGWTNLDDLERRFAPHTRRRLQKDCLDLPAKLDPVTLTATLEPATWKAYKAMRDELVIWLSTIRVATSATAAVKALRLSQITGGFVGGVEAANIEEDQCIYDLIDGSVTSASIDGSQDGTAGEPATAAANGNAIELGREKLDVLLWFIEQRLEADPNLHLVAWTRFRAELFRMVDEVKKKFPQFAVGSIMGGQKKADRLAALALLKPETSPAGPVFVGGIEGTGSFGLDMTASHTCVTMSSGYSPGKSAQTLDRVYGPGQKFPIAYYNVVAVGPRGQRTIDHDILLARLSGEDVATRTAAAWVKAFKEE